MEFILKLMGVWVEKAERIVSLNLTHHGDERILWGFVRMDVVVLLAVIAATIIVFRMYSRTATSVPAGRRYILSALRAAFLALLLVMLIRPVLAVTVAGSVRQTLLLLVDSSSSMRIQDIRDQDADLKRAAIATGAADPKAGLKQEPKSQAGLRSPARIDLVRAALKNPKLNLIDRLERNYDLAVYTFDRDVADVPVGKTAGKAADATQPDLQAWLDKLPAAGQVTALGDAIRDAIYRKRGQRVAGALVITDGASNSGSLPLEAAKLAQDEGVPLYLYGVGITSPRDIIVGTVLAPDVAFIRDEVPVTVRVRSQGLKGQKAALVLTYKGNKVDEKEIDFADDGEQAVSLKFTPSVKDEGDLQAYIEPRSDEVVKDNNYSVPKHLRVIDGRVKVLHIEQSPRWEYKYLQALLMRDRRVEYKSLLFDGDPSITEAPQSPYIKQFPTPKELGENYDVVILGDVDPRRLGPAAMERLHDFVSRLSGSLIMAAGKRFSPQAYRRTPIEKMLPVEFDAPVVESLTAAPSDRPLKIELTPSGKISPLLRLTDKDQDNLNKWSQLPPLFWDARVARPKPAADVLLVDADPGKASRYGKMPIIALQQYGRGKVLYMGTDNTWRWRKNANEETHRNLWSRLVDHMAAPHLIGGAKRTQLSADRERYETGQRVTIIAHLYREQDFEALTEPTVKARYKLADNTGDDREVLLKAMPDQPGVYRGEFVAPQPGTYRLKVDSDPNTPLDFMVTEPTLETGETAMNAPLLTEMAKISHGAFLREEDLYNLPDTVHKLAQTEQTTYEVEFWCSPIYFLLLLGLVTTEWVLRKVVQLK